MKNTLFWVLGFGPKTDNKSPSVAHHHIGSRIRVSASENSAPSPLLTAAFSSALSIMAEQVKLRSSITLPLYIYLETAQKPSFCDSFYCRPRRHFWSNPKCFYGNRKLRIHSHWFLFFPLGMTLFFPFLIRFYRFSLCWKQSSSKKSAKGKRPGKGGNRFWKSIGLGFKTPRDAIEGLNSFYLNLWILNLIFLHFGISI